MRSVVTVIIGEMSEFLYSFQFELRRKKNKRLLNVLVPIGPGMPTGKLLVFMLIAQLVEVGMEGAVGIQQPVFRTAVNAEGRALLAGQLFGEGVQIVRPTDRVHSGDAREFGISGLVRSRFQDPMREPQRAA